MSRVTGEVFAALLMHVVSFASSNDVAQAGRTIVSTDNGGDLHADRDPSTSEAQRRDRVSMTTSINQCSKREPMCKQQTSRKQQVLNEHA